MPLSTHEGALEYAPGEPVRRRKRAAKILFLFVAFVLLALGLAFGPALYRRAVMMHVVRSSRNFEAPAGTVVLDDDPNPLGWNQSRGPILSPLSASARANPDPALLNRLANVCDGGPGYFALFTRAAPRGPEPLVFLHERATPAGRRRIVAVRLTGLTYYRAGGGVLAASYNWVLVEPRGWQAPVPTQTGKAWGGVHIPTSEESAKGDEGVLVPSPSSPAAPGRVTVFMGRPDPVSGSAFDVPYRVNGVDRRFRFVLVDKDGGATLRLEEQDVGGARKNAL